MRFAPLRSAPSAPSNDCQYHVLIPMRECRRASPLLLHSPSAVRLVWPVKVPEQIGDCRSIRMG
jgi:hypothetical protein